MSDLKESKKKADLIGILLSFPFLVFVIFLFIQVVLEPDSSTPISTMEIFGKSIKIHMYHLISLGVSSVVVLALAIYDFRRMGS